MVQAHTPIARFRVTRYIKRYDYELLSSSICIKAGSYFGYENECVLPLGTLRPEIRKVQWRRPLCASAVVSFCLGGVVVCTVLFPLTQPWRLVFTIIAFGLLSLHSLWLALQPRSLIEYSFLSAANESLFAIVVPSRARSACEEFLHRVVEQIRETSRCEGVLAVASGETAQEAGMGTREESVAYSCLPDSLGEHKALAQEEPIRAYRWSGVIDYGEVQLFESFVVVRHARRLGWKNETTIPISELRSEYTVTRYRRRTLSWTIMLAVTLIFFWGIVAWGGSREVITQVSVIMLPLIVGTLAFTMTQLRLVTGYHFHYALGVCAYSVFALGAHRAQCRQFVADVARHILCTSEDSGSTPDR